jgi:uncharacterized small protein (DUF1192 family)
VTAAAAPAIGYSIVCNLGGDRQMTIQCFVGEDESDAVVAARIDRIFRVVDRQKARYSIGDLQKERAKLEDELSQGEEDVATVDLNFNRAQAGLDVQLAELNKQHEQIFNAAYEAHTKARTGEFKPTGHAKANLDRIKSAVDQIHEQRAKNDAERAQHRDGFLISQNRRRDRIALLSAEIAGLEALISSV